MRVTPLRVEEVLAGLRAVLTCARADGALSRNEAAFVKVAARAAGLSTDPLELPNIDVAELCTVFPTADRREQVLQAMVLMTLMDERVAPEEIALIETFAQGLGIDEPRVQNLRQLAEGRVRTLWLDLARRSFARPIFERTLKEKGLTGVWKIVGPMMGLAKDPELANRFTELGKLPENSFGYAYFRFIVDNELGFPGEGIVAEEGMWHDLTHVLTGYDTSPIGEVSVVSFIAGYVNEDPFFWLFTIALQFHLGIRVSPYSPGARGYFEPEVVVPAFRRGLSMKTDISRNWDPWPHLARPLADVRRELGVVP